MNWSLEEILKIYGCKKPFKKNGKLSIQGYIAYEKLLSTLNGVQEITGMIENLDNIIAELDNIEYKNN